LEVAVSQSIITLAKDADLESLPNGSPQIYWTDRSTWGMCAGVAGVRLQATILQVTTAPVSGDPDTYLRVIGQWSSDSRSWTDFQGSLDGGLGSQAMDPSTIAPFFQNQYAGTPYEMAPFVRFGIEVSRTGGRQGRVRGSADIVVLDTLAAAPTQFANPQDDGGTINAVNDLLGPVAITWAYERGRVYVRTSVFTNVTNVVFTVETAFDADADPEFWIPLGTLTFTATNQVQTLALADLDVATRIRCSTFTTSGASPEATFDGHISLRPAP